jgi:hypothetical protein
LALVSSSKIKNQKKREKEKRRENKMNGAKYSTL